MLVVLIFSMVCQGMHSIIIWLTLRVGGVVLPGGRLWCSSCCPILMMSLCVPGPYVPTTNATRYLPIQVFSFLWCNKEQLLILSPVSHSPHASSRRAVQDYCLESLHDSAPPTYGKSLWQSAYLSPTVSNGMTSKSAVVSHFPSGQSSPVRLFDTALLAHPSSTKLPLPHHSQHSVL